MASHVSFVLVYRSFPSLPCSCVYCVPNVVVCGLLFVPFLMLWHVFVWFAMAYPLFVQFFDFLTFTSVGQLFWC